MAKSLRDGLKTNNSSYSKSNLFRGLLDISDAEIGKLNPHVGGRAFFIITKMPKFMELAYPQRSVEFQNLLEKYFTSFDGIGDVSADEKEVDGGGPAKTLKFYQGTMDNFDTFTMNLTALTGSPITSYLEDWMNGMSDKETGYCTYNGIIDDDSNPINEKNPKYHNASGIYFTVDPTGNHIEYSCALKMIHPTNVPKSHHNTQKGDHSHTELSLQFSGIKRENAKINEYAKKMLETITITKNSLDGDSPL